jgi:hypothetical protein
VKAGKQGRCRSCGALVEPAFKHCPGCGEGVGPGGRLEASDDLPGRCHACQSPMGQLHLHCPSCGVVRDDPFEECPGCERPVDAHWLYCGSCGDRIEHLFHLQERGFSCGAAAVRNALSVLGIRQDEPYLREVMGSRAFHGTPDEGFGRGAKAMGLEHEHIVEGSLERLRQEVNSGSPAVVDWRHGAHYVCVVAVTDRHVIFVDSNPRDADVARILTHERFCHLWWDDEDPGTRRHAMHVFRRPARRPS